MRSRRGGIPQMPSWPERPWRRWQSWLLVLTVLAVDVAVWTTNVAAGPWAPADTVWGRVLAVSFWWTLIGSPFAAGLLFLRFRRPELVAALVLLLTAAGSMAMVVAFFHMATRRVSAFVLAYAALQVLITFWFSLALIQTGSAPVQPGAPLWREVLLHSVLPSTLMTGGLIGAAAYRGQRRQAVITLHERLQQAERNREAAAQTGALAERQLIAREMHDVLAHRMSLVTLHAGALVMQADALAKVEPGRAVKLHRSAELVRENSQLALDELRDVLGVLREDADTRLTPPLALPDLPRLIDAWREGGQQVVLHDPDRLTAENAPVPGATSRHAARTVREALTNAARHSPGAAVRIWLTRQPDELRVVVENGPGTRPGSGPGAGQGLPGLRERIALAGGRFDARATEDGGWTVRVGLPLATDRDQAPPPPADSAPRQRPVAERTQSPDESEEVLR